MNIPAGVWVGIGLFLWVMLSIYLFPVIVDWTKTNAQYLSEEKPIGGNDHES